MSNQKNEIGLSFKITPRLKGRLDEECTKEGRSQAEMSKILLAEALVLRDAQANSTRSKYL